MIASGGATGNADAMIAGLNRGHVRCRQKAAILRRQRLAAETHMAFDSDSTARGYWRENLRLMLGLLALWFTVSFGFGVLLVEQLNAVRFFGFKLGFWFAQQGSMYVFVLLIVVYVWQMARIDRKYNVDED
jgi:putative solute:sodium symporter small subunit